MISHNWSPMKRLIWLRGSGITGGAGTYETVTGNPVSFTAKAAPLRQLKVAFSPKQDLHGYDSPWPAGGGKNKFEITLTDVKAANTNGTWSGDVYTRNGVTFTFTEQDGYVTEIKTSGTATNQSNLILRSTALPLTDGTSYIINGCPQGGSIDSYGLWAANSGIEDYGNGVTFTQNESTPIIGRIRIVSGVNTNGLVFKPMIRFASISDASFAPYSNICPILGWDSLNVEQRGKNLLECDVIPASGSDRGIDWVVNQDGSITLSGTATANATIQVMSKRDLPSGTFTVSGVPSNTAGTNLRLWARDDSHYFSATNGAKASGTLGENSYAYITIASGAQLTDPVTIYPMLELGSTASDYVPYNPSSRSISITLGSTVYSGTVDVVTGQGEITHGAKSLAGLDWAYKGTRFDATATSLGIKPPSANNVAVNAISSAYKAYRFDQVGSNNNTFGVSALGGGQYYARIHDDRFTTKEALAEALTDVTFVFELSTPIPISLTPQEVESLAGDNTMWTDAQNLEVTYRSN